ncbi:hypothetical protein LTR66_001706 [Elasticomyces elasticus]|nr:hypothetical protein LTR50_002594 [Elasticomyces elasticus]KAK4999227.1 hypothetical protein LTR66_001706 [Elasticomyces elasticus]
MAFNFTLPLRIAQALFAIIVFALTAFGTLAAGTAQRALAHWWHEFYHATAPSQVGFLLFTSIWTILALLFLILAPWKFPAAAHKFAILGVEAITTLFWFAGFIAQAVFLSHSTACYGHVCSSAKAAAVFGAFEW